MVLTMQVEELAQRLNEAGLKATPQRIAIYQALSQKGHARADAIFDTVRDRFPTISVATVYSALNGMAEVGIISRLILRDNSQYFDITTTPHNHFVCDHCHRVWDVPAHLCPYPEGLYQIAGVVDRINVVFYGVCKECMGKTKTKEVGDGEQDTAVR